MFHGCPFDLKHQIPHDSTSILLQKSGWKKSADCTESVYQATASLATARVRESGMPVVTCLIKNTSSTAQGGGGSFKNRKL